MSANPGRKRSSRDERLDLFRGLAMLIIFIAHVPSNSWNAWIPARFGFSSGAELFVFCSGFASALAFGSVFVRRGWLLGAARILYRVWQIYWAQIGLIFALAALAAGLDMALDRGDFARQFGPLLAEPARALFGLATLSWQPDYLDILPMYLVILALVPAMMALRALNPALPFVFVALLYALARAVGLNLPGNPWTGTGWFFNPFAWQAIFFIGFFFAMKWLPAPPLRDRRLVIASAAFVALSVPLSFWGVLDHWPDGQTLHDLLLAPSTEKTNLHLLRIVHFLATAYLALSLIEPWRNRIGAGAGRLLTAIGRQSLACFLASLVFARLVAVLADIAGHDGRIVALGNLAGFAAILATAHVVAWFKGAPWSGPAVHSASMPAPEPAATTDPSTPPARVSRLREAS